MVSGLDPCRLPQEEAQPSPSRGVPRLPLSKTPPKAKEAPGSYWCERGPQPSSKDVGGGGLGKGGCFVASTRAYETSWDVAKARCRAWGCWGYPPSPG